MNVYCHPSEELIVRRAFEQVNNSKIIITPDHPTKRLTVIFEPSDGFSERMAVTEADLRYGKELRNE